jgi:hypothetical protein
MGNPSRHTWSVATVCHQQGHGHDWPDMSNAAFDAVLRRGDKGAAGVLHRAAARG